MITCSYPSRSTIVPSSNVTTNSSLSSSSVTISSSTTGVTTAAITTNSRFYDAKRLINDHHGTVSPLSVSSITFSNISDEFGPIPPPRMFSDAVISTLQAADANGNVQQIYYNNHRQKTEKMNNTQNDKCLQMDYTANTQKAVVDNPKNDCNNCDHHEQTLVSQISNLNLNNVQVINGAGDGGCGDNGYYINDELLNFDPNFDYEDEWSSPFVEEVPAKEPQFSAVPKKSALKKPKNIPIFHFSTATNNHPNSASNGNIVNGQSNNSSNITNG